ncbi:EamA family transporter [Fodinicola feengrottensis]|uniref:EamA family transporter n=1 Tax=Fodinicola feengrottensis TaxID=435914 RepID=A0ABN2IW81_9ACTN
MAWATADEPIRPDTALDLSPARRAVDGLARAGQRIPGSGLFLIGAFSQYVGTAIAVTLFAVIPAPSVAWARLTVAALILTAWRRPWRLRWPARRWALAVGFGLALASMNVLFYLAIDRLPLGTAVAIEFSGPLVVAAVGARRWRDAGAVVLAIVGVLLLADVSWAGSALGVVFALGAGTMWAGYIVLGSRVAAAGDGVDGLAVGLLAGAVAMAPLLAAGALPAIQDGWLLAACACVGLLSTAVPYALDQIVFRRVGRARFALLQSMLPATAAVVGVLVLRQIPSPPELVGVALVVLAVATSASGRTE